MKTQIGLQLYTVRAFLKTREEIVKTFKRIKGIGYEVVEIACLDAISAAEGKKILDDTGIKAIASHANFDDLKNNLGEVIKNQRVFGVKYIVCPWLTEEFHSFDGLKSTAKELTKIGKILNEEGFLLAYHNHSMEFEKFNGKLGMDILLDESDGKNLLFELDTYWVQNGGLDPAFWCKKLDKKLPILHCKDMGIRKNKPWTMEVGEGNLNWKAILEAAKRSGAEWYIIEQDECYRDAFESIEISFKNIKTMGIK